ncbi:HMA2 domain-containing protein [Neobacillus sp. NPDC093127]|uniref:HMA2 domain-containing protein n=1 Tax=Neobacillus sp. NPDC093127 TaxID=3364296 RepID=UPI00381DFB02
MITSLVGLGASLLAPKLLSSVTDQKIEVVHAMPGRIRLKCERWKDGIVAHHLEQTFSQLTIVKSVSGSPITGSLLIEFNVATLSPEQFDELLRLAVDTSVNAYPYVEAQLMKTMKKTVSITDGLIKKRTSGKADVDSLLSLFLLIYGATKIPVNPAFSSSLLYWAYTIITKEKGSNNGT